MALLAAVVAALGAPASASATEFGINIPNGAASASLTPQAAATGAAAARAFMIWPQTARPDGATIAAWDGIVSSWQAAGMKPVIVVTGVGRPPASVGDFASYIGFFAQRYGGRVAGWEVWNEPDEQTFWGAAGGDPPQYAALLRATYPRVHPYAPVFVGGLTGNNYEFLSRVYAAGGGGSFDGVAVHTDTACSVIGPDQFYRDPNGAVARFSFLGFRSVHDLMTVHGDGAKPIWMTEFGWSTTSQTCNAGLWAGKKPGGVSETNQATYMSQAVHCLAGYPYVSMALWFNLIDSGGDKPETRYGLLHAGGAQKAAYASFVSAVRGQDPYRGQACGDFDGPGIAVKEPLEGEKFTGALPIDVLAADSGGVGRITLFADGHKIRSFTTGHTDPAKFPKELRGRMTWQGAKRLKSGDHVLKIQVIDGSLNSTLRIIHVRKVNPGSLKQVATTILPLQLSGTGRTRTLRTSVQAAVSSKVLPFRGKDHLRVEFQKKRGGAWVTAHKYSKTAKRPLRLKVKLEKASWRVRVVFPRKAPFRGSKSRYTYFTVS